MTPDWEPAPAWCDGPTFEKCLIFLTLRRLCSTRIAAFIAVFNLILLPTFIISICILLFCILCISRSRVWFSKSPDENWQVLSQGGHIFGHSLIRSTITIEDFHMFRLPWWCRIFMFTNQVSQFFVILSFGHLPNSNKFFTKGYVCLPTEAKKIPRCLASSVTAHALKYISRRSTYESTAHHLCMTQYQLHASRLPSCFAYPWRQHSEPRRLRRTSVLTLQTHTDTFTTRRQNVMCIQYLGAVSIRKTAYQVWQFPC